MITRKMEEKFEELMCYFTAKMSEQEENLSKFFNNVLNDLRKEIIKQIQNEIKSHRKHLESENQILKHQVSELRRLIISNQNNHEELEQYGRRLCLLIDGVPTKANESSDDVLDSVKSLFKEVKVNIPESINDRAHRIGSRYLDASSNNYCKSIIIRFATFRHRTMFYRDKNKLKRGVRIKLDLTKSRYNLLKRANDRVKEAPSIKICYADINCRLKVTFNYANQKYIFFSSFDELWDIVDMEI